MSVPQQPTEVSLSPYTNPYDSDGEEGPFFDAVLNELDYCSSDEEEDDLPQSSPVIQPVADPAPQPVPSPTSQPATNNSALQTVMVQAQEQQALTEDDINKMNVNQLKEELRKRNKSTTGVKNYSKNAFLEQSPHLVGRQKAPKKKTKLSQASLQVLNGFV